MLQRDIDRSEVENALPHGIIIEQYPDDKPYPSFLVLQFNDNNQPLHVVAALNDKDRWCYIITVYRPDKHHFKDDFKTRLK